MTCISGRFNEAYGPIINVVVMPSLSSDEENGTPQGVHGFNALIDTGATHTCISDDLIKKLDFAPIGRKPVQGVGGVALHDEFKFMVGFPLSVSDQPNADAHAKHVIQHVTTVTGTSFHKGRAPFDVLLGRNIICTGALTLSFDGHYTLSF